MNPARGFTKSQFVEKVTVELSWPNLYSVKDEKTGLKTPIKFSFTLRRQKKSERDAMSAAAFLQEKSADEKRLDLFCMLLQEPPRGFSDFPWTDEEFERLVINPAREEYEERFAKAGEGQLLIAPFVTPTPTIPIVDDRPLSERAREYFRDEQMSDFVMYAMTAYDAAVVPSELLFRI